tara:strand:- start:2332 stop:4029 length:1698 start_codon:yes stop_codon:yes gene_type:complete
MSKVQVDTIVDKDDISAPSLTKGAIVTGVCTATSFDGAISEWVLGANGSSDYTFTGSGLTGAENDPTLYLKRGQKYRFKNSSGGHPFRIQSTANGSTGTAYNDGVTNNDAGNGTTLEWDVQFDAPDVLYYQCTSHGSMGGKIYIGNSGNSSTLVDLNVSGVTTTGIATVTTSVVVGSAVTANADGVITAGVGTFGSIVSSGNIELATTKKLSMASDVFKLYHATDAYIINESGSLNINQNLGSGDINFSTGSPLTEKLVVKSTGLVGIGTDLPEGKVTVAGISATAKLELKRTNTNTTGAVGAINFTASDGHSVANMYALGDGDNEGAHLVFKTTTAAASNDPFDASTVERLRIGSQGEIGIAGANYGTSGQVLTSGGSGAAPQWADAGGGQWTLLETVTSTSNVQTLDTLGGANGLTQYSGTYKWFKISFFLSEYNDNTCEIGLKISTDGSSWLATNYRMEETWLHGGNVSSYQRANEVRYRFSSVQTRSNYMGDVTFYDPFNTTRNKLFNTRMSGNRDDGSLDLMGGESVMSNYASNNAITGIQLFIDSNYGNPFQYGFYAHA